MTFPEAIQRVIEGKKVARAGWPADHYIHSGKQFVVKHVPEWADDGAYVLEVGDVRAADWAEVPRQ